MSAYQKWCFEEIKDNDVAAVTLIRGFEVPGMRFGTIQDRQRRNSHDDPWRWSPENNVVARVTLFKRLTSNAAVPSVEMNR
eukprot:9314310-Pyramimonas_sp.AAC.1